MKNKQFLQTSKELFDNLDSLKDESEVDKFIANEGLDPMSGTYKGFKYRQRPIGGRRGNVSVSNALNDCALLSFVEIVYNSCDAILMNECKSRGIDPSDREGAPNSPEEAMSNWIPIDHSSLNQRGKQEASKVLSIFEDSLVDGEFTTTIHDLGEGQRPQNMPDTLFSLGDSNKIDVFFTLGRHNMGSLGWTNHLGGRSYRLIASQQNPKIADPNDHTKGFAGFSLSRKLNLDELPKLGFPDQKSDLIVYYEFYVDGNWVVPMFDGNLSSISSKDSQRVGFSQFHNAEYGSMVKGYNFQIGNGFSKVSHYPPHHLKSSDNAFTKINGALKFIIPKLPTPMRTYMPSFSQGADGGNTGMILGLNHALADTPFEDVGSMKGLGGTMPVKVYYLNGNEKMRGHSGIVWKVGSMCVVEPKTVFSNALWKMSYIKDDILIVVDLNELPLHIQNNLLHTGREHFKQTEELVKAREKISMSVRDLPKIQEMIKKARQQALGDVKDYRSALDEILAHKSKPKKLPNKSDSGSNCGGRGSLSASAPSNLKDILSFVEINEGKFVSVPKRDNPNEMVLSKMVNSSVNHFYINLITDARKDSFKKNPIETSVSFSKELDGDYSEQDGEFFIVTEGDGYLDYLITQNDDYRGDSFYLKLKINLKNDPSQSWEFTIPCLANISTKQKKDRAKAKPSTAQRKRPSGKCDINVNLIHNSDELSDYYIHTDGDLEVRMEKGDAVGYINGSDGRVYGLNMAEPTFKKWKKNLSEDFEAFILEQEYLASYKSDLRALEAKAQQEEKSDGHAKDMDIKALNDIHPSSFRKFEALFEIGIKKKLEKRSKS